MIKKSTKEQRAKVKTRIKKKIFGTSDRPRLTIYRSLHHLYAQIVDDAKSQVLAASSTLSPDVREEIKAIKSKKEIAKKVGVAIAQKALKNNIKKVVFDRSGYAYHGVVKSLAEGAREAGLKF
jgi:large subunit ribosomal protein L18